jgi:hypothetical protein
VILWWRVGAFPNPNEKSYSSNDWYNMGVTKSPSDSARVSFPRKTIRFWHLLLCGSSPMWEPMLSRR